MPRPMWRGAISFGMVAIPVRMYLATESKSVSFRLLCPTCHHPIKNKRWCPEENKEVNWNDAVRGFELATNEYVPIEDSDLDQLPLPSTQTINITEFVDDSSIETGLFLKSAYYLEPEKVGVKPYYLLKKALEQTGRVAVGKIALRDREHLCRLALHDKGLLLNTLHWPDEIRSTAEMSFPEDEVEVHDRELDMAVMLINNLAAEFDPQRYHDEYREALLAVAKAKVNNQEIERLPQPTEPSKITDLMAVLKASVEASRQHRDEAELSVSHTRQRTAEAARTRKAS